MREFLTHWVSITIAFCLLAVAVCVVFVLLFLWFSPLLLAMALVQSASAWYGVVFGVLVGLVGFSFTTAVIIHAETNDWLERIGVRLSLFLEYGE